MYLRSPVIHCTNAVLVFREHPTRERVIFPRDLVFFVVFANFLRFFAVFAKTPPEEAMHVGSKLGGTLQIAQNTSPTIP